MESKSSPINYSDTLVSMCNSPATLKTESTTKETKSPSTPQNLPDSLNRPIKKHGKKIPPMGPDAEAVIHDMKTDVNMPFVLKYDAKNKELDLVAKTVMRKKNFATPNKKLEV